MTLIQVPSSTSLPVCPAYGKALGPASRTSPGSWGGWGHRNQAKEFREGPRSSSLSAPCPPPPIELHGLLKAMPWNPWGFDIRSCTASVCCSSFNSTKCSVGPLHQCTIYNSKMARKFLDVPSLPAGSLPWAPSPHPATLCILGRVSDVLKLGSSKPWPEVPEKITEQTEVSTKAFVTYFRALLNWLVTENVWHGEILGWPDFCCSFEEKDTDKMTFLGLELEPDKTKFGQWVLQALSFVMFLVTLLLACRLHSLEKSSQDTSAFKTPTNTYFLGLAMEPHQAATRQWILLGICLILMFCSISQTIQIFTQHNRKPPRIRAEWGSWD
ncbi:hypothetical protein MC885_018279 [Smutsia gigantea]|nr:hypothetical protein MC885_018279 [Smutsia gigantea]